MSVDGWLAGCEAEAARLKAELQPWQDGVIRWGGAEGVVKTARPIKGIELDIAAVERRMSRLRQMG
jgi:hypothetical protein